MSRDPIKDLLTSTILATVRSEAVPVSNSQAVSVTKEIVKDLQPVVEFNTNNEPWYQSYVTVASLGTVITAVGALTTAFATGNVDAQTIAPNITVIVTALVALYGRWKAKRPIGA